jgi:hypothetical protein
MAELSDTTALVTQVLQVGKAVRKRRLNTCKSTTKFVRIENASMNLREPLFLHGLPTRKAFRRLVNSR